MSLNELSAVQAAALIRSGDLTSEGLVAASLRRIEEREPLIGAWAHLDPAYAMAQAVEADAMVRSGAPLGALHGVPVGIKDIIDTAELPTENGSSLFEGRQADGDAAVVRQLKAAGAVIVGKTVTTELAFFGPGKTRNPADPERTPGGSSSGSAAAVADLEVPLALGTQTAGSILRPASYCGVLGFKPTFGLVARTGVLAQSAPLDTIGGYARSAEDLALLVDCMSAADGGDAMQAAARSRSIREELGDCEGAASIRLAFIKTHAWGDGDEAMRRAIGDFVKGLGANAAEVALPSEFACAPGLQRAVQFHDIARNYGPFFDDYPDDISPKLAEVIGIGRGVPRNEYDAALASREPLYKSLLGVLSGFDAVVTPAAPGVAPLGLSSTGSPMFNFLWTYLGMPAISVPVLKVDGLPLGVQIVGRRGEDGKVLDIARRLLSDERV